MKKTEFTIKYLLQHLIAVFLALLIPLFLFVLKGWFSGIFLNSHTMLLGALGGLAIGGLLNYRKKPEILFGFLVAMGILWLVIPFAFDTWGIASGFLASSGVCGLCLAWFIVSKLIHTS